MLSDRERAAFGTWLAALIDEHPMVGGKRVSLSSLARELGGKSATTARINEYTRGKIIPTAKVMLKIARAVHMSGVEALARAGHFRELLILLDEISGIDAAARDGVVKLAVWAFPSADIGLSHRVETAAELLAESAILHAALGEDQGWLADTDFSVRRTCFHPYLEHAADALTFGDVQPPTRRQAAAVYVNAWADLIAPNVAEAARQSMREAKRLIAALGQPQKNSREEKAR
jgi:hypothetical protein